MAIEQKGADLGKEVDAQLEALTQEVKRLERLVSSVRDQVMGLEKSVIYPLRLRLEPIEQFFNTIYKYFHPPQNG